MSVPIQRPIRGFATLVLLSTASAAWAQSDKPVIVVTGIREQAPTLEDIEPERTVDEDGISSYGASTIGEVLDELAAEQGDTGEPVLFVNGRPITDPGDITDYPAEAIERIDVLPRGAGARLGASPDKRAYNVVLKRLFKSDIGVTRELAATDGGYTSWGGELFLTRISGLRRFNLTLRVRDDDELLESDRGILQPAALYPYGVAGNVVADPRTGLAEVDPLLSAAAGRVVTIAGVPADRPAPTLADFAATADLPDETDLGRYRTLRPDTRSYEASVTGSLPLNEWLSAAFNGRIERTSYASLQGLAAGLFIVPADNPASSFSRPVALARYFEDRPLEQRSRSLRGNAGLVFNATRGKWQMTLRGDYRHSDWRNVSLLQGISAATPIELEGANGPDPFATGLQDLVPLYEYRSDSHRVEEQVQFSTTGPVAALPAGSLRLNLTGGWRHIVQRSRSESPFFESDRSLTRDELAAQGSIEIPLTSRDAEALGAIGDLSATLDYAITEVSGLGTVRRDGVAANWQPVELLRLQAAIVRERTLPDPQQLGDATTITEGVRYFDVLRGETVDVRQIYGGNPDLARERKIQRRISATARVPASFDLQLNGEYLSTDLRNPIFSLPPTSAELMAAFPERFIRDAAGRLVTVDSRPINFASRSSAQARWGLNFTVPLAPQPEPGKPVPPGTSRLRLQGNLSHTLNLRDEVVARAGSPTVDLLEGGAIGFGGGTTRHQIDAGAALSDREVGVRLGVAWRSSSALNVGSPAQPRQLRFAPYTVVNLRSFADLSQLWDKPKWLNDLKVSLNVVNLLNQRLDVSDERGSVPLNYQPGYRDPLGRTVELEIRKTF